MDLARWQFLSHSLFSCFFHTGHEIFRIDAADLENLQEARIDVSLALDQDLFRLEGELREIFAVVLVKLGNTGRQERVAE